tara:strand:- start:2676 stop:3308 length:633 start_codon:yes stop_codon:yes gene_type:complete
MKKLDGLYLITDESLINQEQYFETIESVLRVGPALLQLRIKDASYDDLLYKAKKVRAIANKFDTLFIVNDYIDIALESDADGIHIGGEDLDYLEARKRIGEKKIIGVSCYGDVKRSIDFSKLGADYIAIGTPYFTKTKPNRTPTSLNVMRDITSKVRTTPIFAIGGINYENISEVMNTGVNGIAVINSVFGTPDPSVAALNLKKQLEQIV